MLDIRLIRENPDLVRSNLLRRNQPQLLEWLDELVEKDRQWRGKKQENDVFRGARNSISQQINAAKKAGKSIESLLADAKSLPEKIRATDAEIAALEERTQWLLRRLPNLLDASVPEGVDESGNVKVRQWGKPVKPKFEVLHHGEWAKKAGLADFESAVKVSGSGFFYLLGDLALLDLALQRFAVDLLLKKGFVPVQPPLMLNREAYSTMVSLSDFEDVMYRVFDSDQYLIATSEHPLGARFLNHSFSEDELPVRLAGISPCFRREIGKHGLDERGFFRVHQFNKIEQFAVCHPKDSSKMLEELRKNSEELMQQLEIPFRTMNMCTGEMGAIASKKYDIDGWSPREQKYFELVSCSNCTDYQARRLNARFQNSKTHNHEFVHTLNATMIATTRFLRALIENHQQQNGTLRIPKVLQKYMNGKKFIGVSVKAAKASKANKKKPGSSAKAKAKK